MLQGPLLEQFEDSHPIGEMARYHLSSGGKCLRGQLALAEADSLGLCPEKAQTWALACELLHNATLIHDDIQDNDPIRRGQASLWKKFGTAQAINTGDLLIFRAFKLTAQLGQPRLTFLLAETSEQLVRGQAEELQQIPDQNGCYWNSYQEMARLKTGTLFYLPVQGIHQLKEDHSASQQEAWLNLGVCYQIFDDIKDFLGLKQANQKQKDFYEQRTNSLIAWLSQQQRHHQLIQNYLEVKPTSASFEKILEQLNQTIIAEDVIDHLKSFTERQLAFFKRQANPKTQKVILQYLNQVIPNGAKQS